MIPRRLLKFILPLLLILLCLLKYVLYNEEPLAIHADIMLTQQPLPQHLLLNTEVPKGIFCRYPKLNPFDPDILLHWSPRDSSERIECRVEQREFTYIDEQTLTVRLNLTTYDETQHQCSYRTFDRAPNSDFEIVYGTTQELTGDLPFSDYDFFEIWCTERRFIGLWKPQVYHNIHACPRANVKDVLRTSEDHLSVIIYMQDSMSHSSFIRELPKTVQFMEDTMGAFIFDGFHKVGGNTIPNMFPVLTGLFYDRSSTEELGKYIPDGDHDTHYDNLTDTLLFTKFKAAGYATSFIEDYPYYGLFYYSGKGFLSPPDRIFTHYYHPYHFLRDKYAMDVLQKTGISSDFKTPICFGGQPGYSIDLKLLENTVHRNDEYRHFSTLSIADLSHSPIHRHVHKVDEQLKATLDRMLPYLNHTVLIVMSDHGVRYGPARSTTVGFLEERLPFFSIRFPPWFLKKHPHIREALELNSQRLTSHFDTHATLLDILNGEYQRIGRSTQTRHGQSLLRPIPLNRTCASASIPPEICTCNISQSGDEVDDKTTQETAVVALNFMNTLLAKEKDHCSVLQLDKVIGATTLGVNASLLRLRTQPSGGDYEALLSKVAAVWTVVTVTRTNAYGNQAHCVRDKTLREFCFCH